MVKTLKFPLQGGEGTIPGQGTKTPQAVQSGKEKKKEVSKFNPKT